MMPGPYVGVQLTLGLFHWFSLWSTYLLYHRSGSPCDDPSCRGGSWQILLHGANRRVSATAAPVHKMSVVWCTLGIGEKQSSVKMRKIRRVAHPLLICLMILLLWMIVIFLGCVPGGSPDDRCYRVSEGGRALRLLRQAEDRKCSHPTGGGKHPSLRCIWHSDGAEKKILYNLKGARFLKCEQYLETEMMMQ